MVRETVDELRVMLAAGRWLTSGQITALLGRPRRTVWDRLMRDAEADPTVRRGTLGGRNYEWRPKYVAALLAEFDEAGE